MTGHAQDISVESAEAVAREAGTEETQKWRTTMVSIVSGVLQKRMPIIDKGVLQEAAEESSLLFNNSA